MWLGDDADGHFVECGQHSEHDLRQGFGASSVDVVFSECEFMDKSLFKLEDWMWPLVG